MSTLDQRNDGSSAGGVDVHRLFSFSFLLLSQSEIVKVEVFEIGQVFAMRTLDQHREGSSGGGINV